MKAVFWVAAALIGIGGGSALAGPQEDLARAIEAGVKHAYQDERLEAEVEGCQMTTYRWRDLPEQGWVLWTVFQFDMADASPREDKLRPGMKYAYSPLAKGPEGHGFAIIGFEMREGARVRQERSILRPPSGETQPSPRNDGTTHYYEWRDEFIFAFEGPDLEPKVAGLVQDYETYVKDYCTPRS